MNKCCRYLFPVANNKTTSTGDLIIYKMKKSTLLLLFSLLVLICSAYLLITGSPLLVKPLLHQPIVPMGTLITWMGIIALPYCILYGISNLRQPTNRISKRYRTVLNVLIMLAISWGLVSYFLADNWSFTFKQQSDFRGSTRASPYFWHYTKIVVAAPIVFLLIYGLHILILAIKNRIKR